jgi:hypothetical protein
MDDSGRESCKDYQETQYEMKVGILTFHHGYNFGGFMQVYALQETIKGFGIDVEVVNYQNKTHFFRKHLNLIKSKKPKIICSNIQKAVKFNKIHKELSLGKFTFGNKLSNFKYDLLIVGSDEVWNYKNPMVGIDLTYFGKNIKATKKISYAVSFGTADKNIYELQEVVDLIKSFDRISVRDNNSFQIIKKLRLQSEIVLDPTFLFDFRHKIIKPDISEPYALVYIGGSIDPEFKDYIINFAKQKVIKLIAVGYNLDFCHRYIININPFEWLGLLEKANYVFTSMFHGTIFSILLRKKFLTSVTNYRKNKFNPMMENLKLEDRIFDEKKSIEDEINYDQVFNIIEDGKNKSIEFLKDNLN